MPTFSKSNLLIIGSFAAIYFIWGSTYLAAAYAMDELPPFILIGSRFTLAGVILGSATYLWSKKQPITSRQLRNAIFAGILMLGFGAGLTFWSVQYLDTGLIALIIAAQPLILILMIWVLQHKKPTAQAYIGIFLGMTGMYFLMNQDILITTTRQWIGVLFIFLSMLAWGYGTLLVNKGDMPKPHGINSAIQMITGGVFLLVVSFFFEDHSSLDITALQSTTWLAIGYLVFFGSIIAFSAFNYLLTKVSPEKVSTSTYVNPVVAMFLGWFFRDELITSQSIFAAAIMLTGVFFINMKPEYPKQIIKRFRKISR